MVGHKEIAYDTPGLENLLGRPFSLDRTMHFYNHVPKLLSFERQMHYVVPLAAALSGLWSSSNPHLLISSYRNAELF